MRIILYFFIIFLSMDLRAQVDSYRAANNPWIGEWSQERGSKARAEQNARFAAIERNRQLHWQAREEKRLKSTPFYGALALDSRVEGVYEGWAGGYQDEEAAKVQALKECGSPSCVIVASFANTCVMYAQPKRNRRLENIFVGTDHMASVAIEKSMNACEAKFGANTCNYLPREKNAANAAFCSGFQYGVYGEKPRYKFW